jgi:hypothetical protein
MHGALWVAHGYRLFRAYPFAWLALCPAVWVGLFAIMFIPFAGPVIGLLLMPGLTAGLMLAAAEAQHMRPPLPSTALAPLRAKPRAFLQLGFAYAATVFAVMLLGLWLGGPKGDVAPAGGLTNPLGSLRTLMFALPLYVPILLAFWFAPALVYWHGMKPAKALFFSLVAAWRNLRAFLVYGVIWVLLQIVLPLPVSRLIKLMLPADVADFLLALIFVPYGLVVACTFVCSYYSSYVALFPEQPAPVEKQA